MGNGITVNCKESGIYFYIEIKGGRRCIRGNGVESCEKENSIRRISAGKYDNQNLWWRDKKGVGRKEMGKNEKIRYLTSMKNEK